MSSTAQYVQKMTKTTGMSFSVAETIGAVIQGQIQTVTSVTEVLFDICKVERKVMWLG
jgi:hypothetical protein